MSENQSANPNAESSNAPLTASNPVLTSGIPSSGHHGWWWLMAAAALLFLGLAVDGARRLTPTVDEFAHVPAGVAYWREGRFDLYAKNPSLLKLWLAIPLAWDASVEAPPAPRPAHSTGWGPWLYGTDFMRANAERYTSLFTRARLMVIPLTLLAAACVLLWARALFGLRAGAVAAGLFVLSPNIIAHSQLATIDVGCMATIMLTLLLLRQTMQRRQVWWVVGLGFAVGLALSVKFTALLLTPIIPVLILLGRWWNAPGGVSAGRWLLTAGRDLLIVGVLAVLVVNLSYGFHGSFQRLGDLSFGSDFAQSLRQRLPAATPVPLPAAYVSGFDQQKLDLEVGEFGSYLMGEWSDHGWWYYNVIALAVKLPELTWLCLFAGLIVWRRTGARRWDAICLFLPAGYLLVMLSLFNPLNIGIRYLLPVFPPVFVALAAVFRQESPSGTPGSSRWRPALAALALTWAALTAVFNHPQHLRYFNLVSGGPDRGAKWLLDSNLDWGQDLYRLPEVIARHSPHTPVGLLYFGHTAPQIYGLEYGRDYHLAPPTPAPAVLVVSENFTRGYPYVTPGPDGGIVFRGQIIHIAGDHLAWLRDLDPIARAGSLLIYDTRSLPIAPDAVRQ